MPEMAFGLKRFMDFVILEKLSHFSVVKKRKIYKVFIQHSA